MSKLPNTDLYTVTFKYDGDFDLPDDKVERLKKVPDMVLGQLEKNTFELIDFNLSAHYDERNAATYVKDKYLHRSVLEVTLSLSAINLESRDAIYNRCLAAIKTNELYLKEATERDNPSLGILQSVIRFDCEKPA